MAVLGITVTLIMSLASAFIASFFLSADNLFDGNEKV
jgi:hypothetical protein